MTISSFMAKPSRAFAVYVMPSPTGNLGVYFQVSVPKAYRSEIEDWIDNYKITSKKERTRYWTSPGKLWFTNIGDLMDFFVHLARLKAHPRYEYRGGKYGSGSAKGRQSPSSPTYIQDQR